jgi:general secretion pathway protein L
VRTCFIFFDVLDNTPNIDLPRLFWAVCLDDTGEVDGALSKHTPEEIKAMQHGARTVVVLPAAVASIHVLNLPKLSMRKAREAIPYALEEVLAEPVQDVQVAFLRDKENPLQYRVAVLNKRRLKGWVSALEAAGLVFDAMTLDWFALAANEMCVSATDVLVRDTDSDCAINGALSPSVAAQYMKEKKIENNMKGFLFDDSASIDQELVLDKQAGSYRLLIATRLLVMPFLDICQGDFQRKTEGKTYLYWSFVCGGLLGLWFFSVLGFNAFLLHQLHSKNAVVDHEMKTVYHAFFPEATQVISPRFRIEQLLKTHASGAETSFWALLNTFSAVFSKHALIIEHLQFYDETLVVRLVAEDFSALEAFRQQLEGLQLTVTQTEAVTRSGRVTSTLELKL